jgi:hypothetical protein
MFAWAGQLSKMEGWLEKQAYTLEITVDHILAMNVYQPSCGIYELGESLNNL